MMQMYRAAFLQSYCVTADASNREWTNCLPLDTSIKGIIFARRISMQVQLMVDNHTAVYIACEIISVFSYI